MVAIAIAVAGRDVVAPAFEYLSRSIADAAGVVLSDTIVVDVTDSVAVCVCHAVASAHAQDVELVPTTIAIASRDVVAPAFEDLSRSVADAARIVLPNAIVDDVTDTVSIGVCHAVASADAQDVELVAVTIAVAGRDVVAPTLEDLSGPVAYAAVVVLSDAVVVDVTDTVSIGIRDAIASAHT